MDNQNAETTNVNGSDVQQLRDVYQRLFDKHELKMEGKSKHTFLSSLIFGLLLGIALQIVMSFMGCGTLFWKTCICWGLVIGVIIGIFRIALAIGQRNILRSEKVVRELLNMQALWKKDLSGAYSVTQQTIDRQISAGKAPSLEQALQSEQASPIRETTQKLYRARQLSDQLEQVETVLSVLKEDDE